MRRTGGDAERSRGRAVGGGSRSRSRGGGVAEGSVEQVLSDRGADAEDKRNDAERRVRAELRAGQVLEGDAAELRVEHGESQGPSAQDHHRRHDGGHHDRSARAVAGSLARSGAKAHERAHQRDEEKDDRSDEQREVGVTSARTRAAGVGPPDADAVGAGKEQGVVCAVDRERERRKRRDHKAHADGRKECRE